VCDQETSKTRRIKPATGLWKIQPRWVITPRKQTTTVAVQLISELITILFLGLDYFGRVKYRRQGACPVSLSLFFLKEMYNI
jgi:hypothetical protein